MLFVEQDMLMQNHAAIIQQACQLVPALHEGIILLKVCLHAPSGLSSNERAAKIRHHIWLDG